MTGILAALMPVFKVVLEVFLGIFGLDKPAETVVDHPAPQVETSDGKTDAERLNDLGL